MSNETIAITTAGSLIVGDIFAFMGPNSDESHEVIETKAETFGDGVTLVVKSLKDGHYRQSNLHRLNNVCLLHTNFIPAESDPCQGKTLAELLEVAI